MSTTLLTHPLQVLLVAMVLIRLARMAASYGPWHPDGATKPVSGAPAAIHSSIS
jgi:hypothetical protein